MAPLARKGHDADVLAAVEEAMVTAVYGEKGGDKGSRPTLLLGETEIDYLGTEAERLVIAAKGDAEEASKAVKRWRNEVHANLAAMREQCRLPAGVEGAYFGRMVTPDPNANIEAAIHVSHAIMVRAKEVDFDLLLGGRRRDGHGR